MSAFLRERAAPPDVDFAAAPAVGFAAPARFAFPTLI
jgi:hypothetical protein